MNLFSETIIDPSKLFYDNFWEESSKKATKLEGVEEIFRIFHDLGWLQYIFFFL